MKCVILISLIVTAQCGLLNLLDKNEAEEAKNDDMLKKAVTALKDDGKIVIDTLTAPLKKPNSGKKEAEEEKKPEEAVTPGNTEVTTKAIDSKPAEVKAEDGESKATPATEAAKETSAAPPKAK